MIEFPTSPAVGTLVTAPDGMQWRWDGDTWEIVGAVGPPDSAWKAPVVAATQGVNITLSGLQTVDDVGLAAGNRVLVKDQTNGAQNGIYVAATGAWARAADFVTEAQIRSAIVPVDYAQKGANAASVWMVSNPKPNNTFTGTINFARIDRARSYPESPSGTAPQPVLRDNGKFWTVDNASPTTITLPLNPAFPFTGSDAGFADSYEVHYMRDTAATVTFVAGAGASIKSVGGKLAIANRNGVVTAKVVGYGIWALFGDLG